MCCSPLTCGSWDCTSGFWWTIVLHCFGAILASGIWDYGKMYSYEYMEDKSSLKDYYSDISASKIGPKVGYISGYERIYTEPFNYNRGGYLLGFLAWLFGYSLHFYYWYLFLMASVLDPRKGTVCLGRIFYDWSSGCCCMPGFKRGNCSNYSSGSNIGNPPEFSPDRVSVREGRLSFQSSATGGWGCACKFGPTVVITLGVFSGLMHIWHAINLQYPGDADWIRFSNITSSHWIYAIAIFIANTLSAIIAGCVYAKQDRQKFRLEDLSWKEYVGISSHGHTSAAVQVPVIGSLNPRKTIDMHDLDENPSSVFPDTNSAVGTDTADSTMTGTSPINPNTAFNTPNLLNPALTDKERQNTEVEEHNVVGTPITGTTPAMAIANGAIQNRQGYTDGYSEQRGREVVNGGVIIPHTNSNSPTNSSNTNRPRIVTGQVDSGGRSRQSVQNKDLALGL